MLHGMMLHAAALLKASCCLQSLMLSRVMPCFQEPGRLNMRDCYESCSRMYQLWLWECFTAGFQTQIWHVLGICSCKKHVSQAGLMPWVLLIVHVNVCHCLQLHKQECTMNDITFATNLLVPCSCDVMAHDLMCQITAVFAHVA